MSANQDKKKLLVSEALSMFRDSAAIIITDYQGLTVAQLNKLRRELKKVGAKYKVLKNTLSKRILKELEINSNLSGFFTGVTGLVFCKDYVATIKALTKFAADNESLKIKVGYIEHKSYTAKEIKEISKLSSKEELIAKFVGMMKQPLNRLVGALSSPKRKIVYSLKALADKKETK